MCTDVYALVARLRGERVFTPLGWNVPSRRRSSRSVYRPGQLSDELKNAIKEEAENFDSTEDELELIHR